MAGLRDEEQARDHNSWSIFLEIDAEGDRGLIQVPANIKNLAGATLTLQVNNPWHLAGTENLLGKKGRLCLAPPGGGKPVRIGAGVSWANWVGDKRRQMLLGLELANPTLETYKLLERHLAHSPKDLKGLWERYDQARKEPPDSLVPQRVYLAGMILVLGGLALQISEPRAAKLLGWMLWFFSSVGVASACLWSLWQKRASI